MLNMGLEIILLFTAMLTASDMNNLWQNALNLFIQALLAVITTLLDYYVWTVSYMVLSYQSIRRVFQLALHHCVIYHYLDCTEGDVRLVGGAHNFQGTVQICLDNVWCLVAQQGWDDNDARVVCRQLKGYNPNGKVNIIKALFVINNYCLCIKAAKAVYNSTYGHPRRAIRYSNVYCRGYENKLADCSHHTLELNVGRTYQAEVAGVNCQSKKNMYICT